MRPASGALVPRAGRTPLYRRGTVKTLSGAVQWVELSKRSRRYRSHDLLRRR
ncbi:hypothetical protein COLINT_03492 [Collinsella intestinalis DSM 13280]|uniref:Uncharacterized protein n=1 Tax=Collinsella intestinalis DSM 13280 TaxID=521003 RepID=C4FBN0_9ACTN|nr:hypothetical protein COLINT_03492 [Collinsella intestinalis DSM 13280]